MKPLMRPSRTAKLNRKDQLLMLSYLARSLKNGFSLQASVKLLPVLWPRQQALMTLVVTRMTRGEPLAQVMLALGFSKTVVTQLVIALEQGNLVESLEQLTQLTQLKNSQLRKLGAQLAYPLVLVIMMVTLLLLMQNLLSSQLINHEEHFGDWILLGLAILVSGVAGVGLRWFYLINQQNHHSLVKLSRMPVIGPVIRLYIHYLVVYDLGLMLSSGFSLSKICEYASQPTPGSLQQFLGAQMQQRLHHGQQLERLIREEPFLPNQLLLLIKTGANRTELSQGCLLLGRTLFLELTQRIEVMVVNIQPICFVLIGISILGLYLKLLLPIYGMMQQL